MRISNEPKENTIKFRIDNVLYNRLQEYSKRSGVSVSEIIRESIKVYLDKRK